MTRPTPGSVSGTKIIVFEGGPPEWAGTVHGVSKLGGGQAERWDHVGNAAVVYGATERTQQVPIVRHRQGGDVVEMKTAQVYEYLGYREEVEREN